MTTIKGLREIEPYVAGSQPSGENLIKLIQMKMLMDQVQK